jgi:ubiquinone/menaquinone biosynthesis C-methylase UbiE
MYEEILVKSVFKYRTPQLIERAAPQTGEQVLDVACGTGVAARTVVPIVAPAGKVTGLDKSSAIAQC